MFNNDNTTLPAASTDRSTAGRFMRTLLGLSAAASALGAMTPSNSVLAADDGPEPWEDVFVATSFIEADLVDEEFWLLPDERASFTFESVQHPDGWGRRVWTGYDEGARAPDDFDDHVRDNVLKDSASAVGDQLHSVWTSGRHPDERRSSERADLTFSTPCVGDETWLVGRVEFETISPNRVLAITTVDLFEIDENFLAPVLDLAGEDACTAHAMRAIEEQRRARPNSPSVLELKSRHHRTQHVAVLTVQEPTDPHSMMSDTARLVLTPKIGGHARARVVVTLGLVRAHVPDQPGSSVASDQLAETTTTVTQTSPDEPGDEPPVVVEPPVELCDLEPVPPACVVHPDLVDLIDPTVLEHLEPRVELRVIPELDDDEVDPRAFDLAGLEIVSFPIG